MWRAIKATFGSVWGWLGIIGGSLSLINLWTVYLNLEVGPVLDFIMTIYTKSWLEWLDYPVVWTDWNLPVWLKDFIALYIVFCAALYRGLSQRNRISEIEVRNHPVQWFRDFKTAFVYWPKHLRRGKDHFLEYRSGGPLAERAGLNFGTAILNLIAIPVVSGLLVAVSKVC